MGGFKANDKAGGIEIACLYNTKMHYTTSDIVKQLFTALRFHCVNQIHLTDVFVARFRKGICQKCHLNFTLNKLLRSVTKPFNIGWLLTCMCQILMGRKFFFYNSAVLSLF